VTGVGSPPAAATRWIGDSWSGAKRIDPSEFQVPPLPLEASHRDNTGPPAASIFLSLPSEKNAMVSLFHDQNG
jgi:hypothetical protein